MIEAAIWGMIIWFVLAFVVGWGLYAICAIIGAVAVEEFGGVVAGVVTGAILGAAWFILAMYHSISSLITLVTILAN